MNAATPGFRAYLAALLLAVFVIVLPADAHAGCTSPTGNEGEFFYNQDFKIMQFCDGANWNGMAGGSSGGTAITDGNKGDLTVSGAGATWVINSAAVQYSKIQNVTSSVLLGRYGATGGTMQEITLGTGLSLNSTTGVLSATGSLSGSGAAGYVPYWSSATALAYDNTTGGQFFWDATNHRLGIGLAAPTQALDVSGKITGNALIVKPITGAAAPSGGLALGWSTNGTDVWRASGKVGIGTASPSYKLEVAPGAVSGGIRLWTTGSHNPEILMYDTTDAGATIFSQAGFLRFGRVNATGSWTANSMSIDPSGNVGIGTTSPQARLQVQDSGGATEQTIGLNSAAAGVNREIAITTNNVLRWVFGANSFAESGSSIGSDFYLNRYDDSGSYLGTGLFIARASGNVGIGTTSPSAPLQVETTTANSFIMVRGPGSGVEDVQLQNATNTKVWALSHRPTSESDMFGILHYDGTTWTHKLDILTNGNLGIGTSSPDAQIQAPNGGHFNAIGVGVCPYGTCTYPYETLQVNGNLRVWFGTTERFVFAADGTAYKPGGGSWTASSDARLKDIDGAYDQGLDSIARLNTVRFHYKKDNARKEPSDRPFVGMIAQDVEKVFPEAVSKGADGYLSLDTTPINFAVINAIKELKADNDNLRVLIGNQNRMIEAQGRELAALRAKVEARH